MTMKNEITTRAYAKINFGLKVCPRVEDESHNFQGYHNIESIFQTIDLYDELIVTVLDSSSERKCVVNCNSMKLPENNTLVNAYNAFAEIAGRECPSVNVELKKGIPAGGGLGGGSSDAAALIRVMQQITGITLADGQLDYIASKTGSDVFFFMHCDEEGKGCALVSGRGEIIKSIEPRTGINLLMIFPDVSSSTKEAYYLVDKVLDAGTEVQCPDFNLYEKIYNSPLEDWSFVNTFTPVIAKAYPQVFMAIEDVKKTGCCYAEMSGSGSTVFGAFTLRQQAISASNLLGETWNCKLVQTI